MKAKYLNGFKALFGEITAEELEAIRSQSEAYDNMIARFQKRPRTDSENDNNTITTK